MSMVIVSTEKMRNALKKGFITFDAYEAGFIFPENGSWIAERFALIPFCLGGRDDLRAVIYEADSPGRDLWRPDEGDTWVDAKHMVKELSRFSIRHLGGDDCNYRDYDLVPCQRYSKYDALAELVRSGEYAKISGDSARAYLSIVIDLMGKEEILKRAKLAKMVVE